MKIFVIIAVAALIAFSAFFLYGRQTGEVSTIEATEAPADEPEMDTEPTEIDLSEDVENLQPGLTYTSIFEYIDFNDDGDDFFLDVKKDEVRRFIIISGSEAFNLVEVEAFNRGDLVEVEWVIEGDMEIAMKITKIKDGNVTLFRKEHPEPLNYYYDGDEYPYTDTFLNKIYKKVEFYLANSKQELVKAALKEPSVLGYSIEEQRRNDETGIVIGIYSEFEGKTHTFQWLYLSEEDLLIYEYDLPNDELIEFESLF